MGTSTIIAGLNGELARQVKSASNETLPRKNELTTKALTTLEAHQSVEHNILSNLSLTQRGQAEALKKLGTNETAPALKWMKNVIKDMQDTDQGHRKRFFTITSGIDDLAERMPIFVYLWSKLDTLNPNERIKQFFQAAEQDQVKVLAAMLTNPLGAMVDEEVKERALTERAERLFPQQYDNFEQNAILLEHMTMVRDWIGRWLALEVGVDISVIRTNLGDEIADVLTTQATGIPAGV